MVERYRKKGPISFEEMYRLIKDREARGQLVRNDELALLWGYDPDDVDDEGAAARQRTVTFEQWLRDEYGMCWPSTGNRRLYAANEVERRKPKKATGSFEPST